MTTANLRFALNQRRIENNLCVQNQSEIVLSPVIARASSVVQLASVLVAVSSSYLDSLNLPVFYYRKITRTGRRKRTEYIKSPRQKIDCDSQFSNRADCSGWQRYLPTNAAKSVVLVVVPSLTFSGTKNGSWPIAAERRVAHFAVYPLRRIHGAVL